jgi:hypothetical protein
MTFFVGQKVFDDGLNYIKNNATHAILIASYSTDYSAINGALKVASAAVTSTDFTLANGASSGSRKITAALTGKSGGNALQGVADGTPMHIAIVNSTGTEVLLVFEESTDQAIVIGNPITFNSDPEYTKTQPA